MTPGGRQIRLLLHGEPFARLAEQPGRTTTYDLEFDPAWLDRIDRPVGTLAAINWRLDLVRTFPKRLPAFLTNLLPERGPLRRRITRAAGIDPADDLALLDFVGGDMNGALTAQMIDTPSPVTGRRAREASPPPSPEAERLRWSLGGVQLKFSVDRTDRLTLPLRGGIGRWILKVPDRHRPDLPRAELATMTWARKVGFEVPSMEIIDPSEVDGLPADAIDGVPAALLVRRFDRLDDHTRVHMEELASVMQVHPEHKYCEPRSSHPSSLIELGRLVRRFAGSQGARLLLQRVVFDALAGNSDAHTKNWAFLFRDGRTAELAPVYDVCPTILFGDPPTYGLRFVVGGTHFQSLSYLQVRQFAHKIGADPEDLVEAAREVVERAASTFEGAMAEADLPGGMVARLREHWMALPIVGG